MTPTIGTSRIEHGFSKEGFPYTSSQYRKFSSQILRDAFGFTEKELDNF